MCSCGVCGGGGGGEGCFNFESFLCCKYEEFFS